MPTADPFAHKVPAWTQAVGSYSLYDYVHVQDVSRPDPHPPHSPAPGRFFRTKLVHRLTPVRPVEPDEYGDPVVSLR